MDNQKVLNVYCKTSNVLFRLVQNPELADLVITDEGKVFSNKNRKEIGEKKVSSNIIEKRVCDILLALKVPYHLKGYNFIKQALVWMIENEKMNPKLSKELYVMIAKKNNCKVETISRSIYTALDITWNKDSKFRENLFNEKATPLIFFCKIYQYYFRKYK